MSKVKLQTITPVHVGSGNFLRNNTDFVVWTDGEDSCIGVVDPRKILKFVGEDQVNNWVSLIERGEDTKDFVNKKGGCSNPEKYSSRVLLNFAGPVYPTDTLKECIHDGMGRAYIPGSSIKGAIRTAVLATLAKKTTGLEQKITERRNAKSVEQIIFGGDPNSDIFRFLLVGDAYFEGECEIASRLININVREQTDLKDKSKHQLVESIGLDNESEIQMKLDKRYYEWAREHWPQGPKVKPLGNMPEEMQNLTMLFAVINAHTKMLVEDEVAYWQEFQNRYTGASGYINSLKSVIETINACDGRNECVLRLGHASGWRFITGAWTEEFSNFNSVVVPASRPGNHKYVNYDFPKSRRLDTDNDVYGFVKLALTD